MAVSGALDHRDEAPARRLDLQRLYGANERLIIGGGTLACVLIA